jgi:valyl-tRNA synthetase
VRFVIQAASADAAARLGRDMLSLKTLLRAEEIEVETGAAELAMPSAMVELGTLYLPLEGLVDIAAEAKRVSDELAKARGFLRGVDAKLNIPGFVGKAPPAVVEQQRERQAELVESIGRLEKLAKTFELAAASSEG